MNLRKMSDLDIDQEKQNFAQKADSIKGNIISADKSHENMKADNDLDLQKLREFIDEKHPRKVIYKDGVKSYEPHPWFSTNIGWHCCIKKLRDNDIKQYGVGVVLYFKFQKYFAFLFFLMTLLSLPNFLIYAEGGSFQKNQKENEQSSSIRSYLSIMSMGNMAVSTAICSSGMIVNKSVTLNFACEEGIIYDMKDQKWGLESQDNELSCVNTDFLTVDTDCSYYAFNSTIQKKIDKKFIEMCNGQKFCQFKVDFRELPSTYDQEFYGKNVEKSSIGLALVFDDLFVVTIYLLALGVLKRMQKLDTLEIQGHVKKCSDYSIQFKNLPEGANIYEIKAELWEWLERKLHEVDGLDPKSVSYVPRIVDIYFGYTNYASFSKLRKIRGLEKAFIQTRKRLKLAKKGKEVELYMSLQKIIKILKKKIESYQEFEKTSIQKLKPKYAYVILLQEEDSKKLINTYKMNWFKRKLLNYQDKDKYARYLFKDGKFPEIVRAPQPSNIIWNNLKYTKWDQSKRSLQINFVTIILMLISFFLVIYGKHQDKIIKTTYGDDTCDSKLEILERLAVSDYNQPEENRRGMMHCFCLKKYTSYGKTVQDYRFSDGQFYCSEWYTLYMNRNNYVYYAAFAISIVNIMIKFIIKKVSLFQRMHTLTEILENTTMKMFTFQIFNTGVIMMLVNWNLKDNLGLPDTFPVLTGDYSDFTVEWYQKIGMSLCVSLMLKIATAYYIKGLGYALKYVARWYDRKWTCNMRRTRLFVQEDWHSQYLGVEFSLEQRYSQMMAVIFIAMIFSAGMPFLYIVACMSFTINYWIDKILCKQIFSKQIFSIVLKMHKKPIQSNNGLADKVRIILSLAIVWHLGISFMMMSNDQIFPLKKDDQEVKYTLPAILSFLDEKRLNHKHSLITFVAFFISLALTLFYDRIIKTCIKIWERIKQSQKVQIEHQDFSNVKGPQNFYEAIGLQGIINERKKAEENIRELEAFMRDNEVSHKVRLLHHRMNIKLDKIESALATKQAEVSAVLKKALIQGLMAEKRRKAGLPKLLELEDPEQMINNASFPCKLQDVPTYDLRENDFYKDAFATAERLQQILKDIELIHIENVDNQDPEEIKKFISS
eukprot:403354206